MTDEERAMNQHIDERKAKVAALLNEPLTPPARKTRSDAGIKKGPKVVDTPDAIKLTVTLERARELALTLGAAGKIDLAFSIQDQIMEQLQKSINALQKSQTK